MSSAISSGIDRSSTRFRGKPEAPVDVKEEVEREKETVYDGSVGISWIVSQCNIVHVSLSTLTLDPVLST